MTEQRFDAGVLRSFAIAALLRAGLPEAPARSVAEGLLEADLLGHNTHGLALLADYIEEIDEGRMATLGGPEVLSDFGAVATWDARRLPGIWTTELAITEASGRARKLGLGAIALRRSHHIACLASFLEAPARSGLLVLVFCSDPGDSVVAPHGGVTPVLMPDPLAAGIPARPDPILIDISTSITTMAMSGRARREGAKLPHPWLMDAQGRATDDPSALGQGTTILPLGGKDHGHKGFALGLLVETLTQGLGGFGRRDKPTDWGASVLVLAFDPAAFGGLSAFQDQIDFIADACRRSAPVPGGKAVRMPGESGLAKKRAALQSGVPLRPDLAAKLAELAATLGIPAPTTRG
ncbi:MAG TPA: Ldh family oxidoreductase [Dongiaceae bacterium]